MEMTILYPPQREIVERGLLDFGFNCVLQMPTGSGKTWLAEYAMERVMQRGYRAIYLTPLRALASELLPKWKQRFAQHTVGIFTGDYKSFPTPFGRSALLIMTPERLDACTRNWRTHWHWIPEIDLVVVDELHLLADAQRGPRLEGTLSRIRRLNPFIRILGLSATLGNRGQLADWLDGVEYGSTWRVTPISWRIARYRKATEKPALMLNEVRRTIGEGGKSLVFVQSRRRAEALSRFLQGKGIRAKHHHAGMQYETRQEIEGAFRAGQVDVLVATATLEMGVNLPVRQVILYDLQQFDGVDFRPISTISAWQRGGRAGRPGLDDTGEVVLLAPVWDRQADRYEDGNFEPIRSGLRDERALAEQIVAEVASGMSYTYGQLRRTFSYSLAALQNSLPAVDAIVEAMCSAEMLTVVKNEKGERLKATRLGRIAVRHFLAPATILAFKQLLTTDELTFFDLLLLATSQQDCQPILPVDFEELDAVAYALAKQPSYLLQNSRQSLSDLLGIDGLRLLSALKMAWVVQRWTQVGDVQQVADETDCYPFEVRRLCESLERLLTAMVAVLVKPEDEALPADVVAEGVPLRERIDVLRWMVKAGLDGEGVTLTLVAGIGVTLARRLVSAEIDDIEHLAAVEIDEVSTVKGISAKRAAKLIAIATALLDTHSALRYRELGPLATITPAGWPTSIDPYRLRRARDLTVTGADGGHHLVTGGLEPHIVRLIDKQFVCDCVDVSRGHLCKHILAVRLKRGERKLKQLIEQLKMQPNNDRLDLFDLWFSSDHGGRRKRR